VQEVYRSKGTHHKWEYALHWPPTHGLLLVHGMPANVATVQRRTGLSRGCGAQARHHFCANTSAQEDPMEPKLTKGQFHVIGVCGEVL